MRTNNRELWVKRVERWRDSGLSAKEFAAEIGVNPWTLAHWKWRLGAEQRGKLRPGSNKSSPARPSALTFVEVAPTAVAEAVSAPPSRKTPAAVRPAKERVAPAGHEPLEVVLLNGLRIRVPVQFEAASLGRVVAVLQGR